jgi:DNA-binding response OmpR family regulator
MTPEQIKNIRLLLEDDEADFRKNLAKHLMKREIAAHQAGDGDECPAVLAEHGMDVVEMLFMRLEEAGENVTPAYDGNMGLDILA